MCLYSADYYVIANIFKNIQKNIKKHLRKPKWKLGTWSRNEYWIAEKTEEDNSSFHIGVRFDLELFTPATEEEYLLFIKKQTYEKRRNNKEVFAVAHARASNGI